MTYGTVNNLRQSSCIATWQPSIFLQFQSSSTATACTFGTISYSLNSHPSLSSFFLGLPNPGGMEMISVSCWTMWFEHGTPCLSIPRNTTPMCRLLLAVLLLHLQSAAVSISAVALKLGELWFFCQHSISDCCLLWTTWITQSVP